MVENRCRLVLIPRIPWFLSGYTCQKRNTKKIFVNLLKKTQEIKKKVQKHKVVKKELSYFTWSCGVNPGTSLYVHLHKHIQDLPLFYSSSIPTVPIHSIFTPMNACTFKCRLVRVPRRNCGPMLLKEQQRLNYKLNVCVHTHTHRLGLWWVHLNVELKVASWCLWMKT